MFVTQHKTSRNLRILNVLKFNLIFVKSIEATMIYVILSCIHIICLLFISFVIYHYRVTSESKFYSLRTFCFISLSLIRSSNVFSRVDEQKAVLMFLLPENPRLCTAVLIKLVIK